MLDECSGISESDKLIRKLRKKLRQIERLEFLGRPLNDEERAKVWSLASIYLFLIPLYHFNYSL